MRSEASRTAPHYAAALDTRHRQDVRKANLGVVGALVGATCLLLAGHVAAHLMPLDASSLMALLDSVAMPLTAPAKALLGLGEAGTVTVALANGVTIAALWLGWALIRRTLTPR